MAKNLFKKSSLQTKPILTNGLASPNDDRQLEVGFQNLRQLEDVSKKLYKEVRKYGENVIELHRLELKIASELSNSQLCHSDEVLRHIAEEYSSVVYQLGLHTDDLTLLMNKTVVEPMKKLNGEFPSIAAALKKRDSSLSECLKCQSKLEKLEKLERTGTNIVKTEQARKALQSSKDDFIRANRLLLLELPQFYEKRIDYFQPCLQALIRAQVEYFGESIRLFTNLVGSSGSHGCTLHLKTDTEYQEGFDKKMNDLKSLSIVGK